MNANEIRVATLIQHLYDAGFATAQERDDMMSVLKGDGVFAPLTGVTAIVANNDRLLSKDLLDEVMSLKDVYDEDYFAEFMESQGLTS